MKSEGNVVSQTPVRSVAFPACREALREVDEEIARLCAAREALAAVFEHGGSRGAGRGEEITDVRLPASNGRATVAAAARRAPATRLVADRAAGVDLAARVKLLPAGEFTPAEVARRFKQVNGNSALLPMVKAGLVRKTGRGLYAVCGGKPASSEHGGSRGVGRGAEITELKKKLVDTTAHLESVKMAGRDSLVPMFKGEVEKIVARIKELEGAV